tara:strand:- start:1670 stop:2599 length:930 start_codon:yes stop_codon:yes gene_type:complete
MRTLISCRLLRAANSGLTRIIKGFLLILVITSFFLKPLFAEERLPLGSAKNPLRMIFVPSGDSQTILEGGGEIARLLSRTTGLTVKSSVATSYAAAIEAMGVGKVDIGWLATFSYVLAKEKYDVDLLFIVSRFGSPIYRGQIVARMDSGIASLADLKNKTFAFVDPASTSGHIFIKTLLLANGYQPDTFFSKSLFAGSHNAVIFSVLRGEVDAGATYDDARTSIAETHPEVFDRIKIVAYTQDIPNDTVCARNELDPEIKEKIRKGLNSLSKTREGSNILKRVYGISGLMDFDTLFDPVRNAQRLLDMN